MPSEKAARKAVTRYKYNQMAENAAKTHVRAAREALSHGSGEEARHAVLQAVSTLDRAVKRGAVKANTAARRKSRLTKGLNAATPVAEVKRSPKARATRKAT